MSGKRSHAAVDGQKEAWSSQKKQKQSQFSNLRSTKPDFQSLHSPPQRQAHPPHASEASVRRPSDQSNGYNPDMPPPPLPPHAQDPLTLLRSLLDQLTDLNTPLEPQALEHARNLHKTLYHNPRQTTTVAELNARRPPSASYIPIPSTQPPLPRAPSTRTSLPPLPDVHDEQLATAAFTHSSISPSASTNYERLEFLGDAYIEIIATRLIYAAFPTLPTGSAAQLRESLVNNATLASFSREYGFGERAKVAGGEREAHKAWIKILADVFEAYVAAVILSRPVDGFSVAEEWLTSLWAPRVREFEAKKVGGGSVDTEPRQRLANMLLFPQMGIKLEYRETRPGKKISANGTQVFSVGCYLTGWGYERFLLGVGEGTKKGVAEAEAARDAFERNGEIIEKAGKMKLEEVRKKKAIETRKEFEAIEAERERLEKVMREKVGRLDGANAE
ncbi:hypothetical protein H2201_005404 [Coniosporium apollinis]|uniref:RNase III domain-containing protein n=1 Tax=Coniosporium apollinis TaxID=61459 RepID=A0ABQ9NPZ7_9PEZI|nr:hypothetical protein H2201_005404 [Coniosporium apollinis]